MFEGDCDELSGLPQTYLISIPNQNPRNSILDVGRARFDNVLRSLGQAIPAEQEHERE